MRPKHGLAGFLGVGFLGLIQQWVPASGSRVLDLVISMPWLLLISGALAIVTLAPAAFNGGGRWLAYATALLPGAVLGFVAEQLEEALVPGGAGAGLWNNVLLGVFAVAATAWLARRATGNQRRWIAYGLGLGAVLAVASLTGVGFAMLAAQLLTLTAFLGLAIEAVRTRRSETGSTAPGAGTS